MSVTLVLQETIHHKRICMQLTDVYFCAVVQWLSFSGDVCY